MSSHTDGSGSGVSVSSGAEVLGDGEAGGVEVPGAVDSGAEALGELLGESLGESVGESLGESPGVGAVSSVDWLGDGSPVAGVLSELLGGGDDGVSPVA
ncbi:hypothetical protein ACVV2G_06430 [Streptomyces ziwulingensis]